MATDRRSTQDGLDERKLGTAIAIGLPLVTVLGAIGAGLVIGLATAILVLAAGLLLGVIAIFWASLRVLSGDAQLSPELEALDASAQGVDALAGRKKMLLRALKDLDNEKALGKLDDEDYEQISTTYRAELKDVLRRIDESLIPHRPKAEELARKYLANVGLGDDAREDEAARKPTATRQRRDDVAATRAISEGTAEETARRLCGKCGASNEADAKFCKGCAAALTTEAESAKEARVVS